MGRKVSLWKGIHNKKMKKTTTLLILNLAIAFGIQAQTISWTGKANLSIGMDYQSINYYDGEIFYSPGGGIGIEGGIQLEIIKNLNLYTSLGYQLNFALQAENSNGVSNRSSFSFNRKFLTLGVSKIIQLSDINTVQGLLFGGGVNFSIPGTMKIIENKNTEFITKYKPNLGYHFETGLRLDLSQGFYLDATIRYRALEFSGKSFSYSGGSHSGTGTEFLNKLNASGIELGATFVKKLK